LSCGKWARLRLRIIRVAGPRPKGREILVAGQKSGVVYAFDPDAKGKILWQTRVGTGGLNGGVQWGMASDGQKVYASVSDVSAVMNTAGPVGGATFDPVKGGGLTALHLEDGGKAWFAPSHPCNPPRPGCSPAQSQALTLISGVVFPARSMDICARSQPKTAKSSGISTLRRITPP